MVNSRHRGRTKKAVILGTGLTALAGLGLAGQALAGIGNPWPAEMRFSLDIGSDKEISDPFGGALEDVDPGDVHASSTFAGTLLGAAPPAIDDAILFGGIDPAPVQGMPASAVPMGGGAARYSQYFDLDGLDQIDFDLRDLIPEPGEPLPEPLPEDIVAGECVHPWRNLILSFEDDPAIGWGAAAPPRVPTEGPSSAGVLYGATFANDELTYIGVDPFGTVLFSAPIADERTVHIDLSLNPDGVDPEDDDTDALDLATDPCRFVLFSADHEGFGTPIGLLDPGVIYLASPTGAMTIPIVTQPMLGIMDGTDIDAFELVLLPSDPDGGGPLALALLFSVDEDDVTTPGTDESGGLDPTTIYGSFLTGFSFPFVDGPSNGFDDVDGLTNWREEVVTPDTDGDGILDPVDNCLLVPNPAQIDTDGDGIGNWCDPDYNNDCVVNFTDLGALKAVFFTSSPLYDCDSNGIVNFFDLACLKAFVFGAPGPSGLPNVCDC